MLGEGKNIGNSFPSFHRQFLQLTIHYTSRTITKSIWSLTWKSFLIDGYVIWLVKKIDPWSRPLQQLQSSSHNSLDWVQWAAGREMRLCIVGVSALWYSKGNGRVLAARVIIVWPAKPTTFESSP